MKKPKLKTVLYAILIYLVMTGVQAAGHFLDAKGDAALDAEALKHLNTNFGPIQEVKVTGRRIVREGEGRGETYHYKMSFDDSSTEYEVGESDYDKFAIGEAVDTQEVLDQNYQFKVLNVIDRQTGQVIATGN